MSYPKYVDVKLNKIDIEGIEFKLKDYEHVFIKNNLENLYRALIKYHGENKYYYRGIYNDKCYTYKNNLISLRKILIEYHKKDENDENEDDENEDENENIIEIILNDEDKIYRINRAYTKIISNKLNLQIDKYADLLNVYELSNDEIHIYHDEKHYDNYSDLLNDYDSKEFIENKTYDYYLISEIDNLFYSDKYIKFIKDCRNFYELINECCHDNIMNKLSKCNFECSNNINVNVSYVLCNNGQYIKGKYYISDHKDTLIKYNNHDYMLLNFGLHFVSSDYYTDNDEIKEFYEIIHVNSEPKYYILDGKEYKFPEGLTYLLNPLIYYRLLGFDVHGSKIDNNDE